MKIRLFNTYIFNMIIFLIPIFEPKLFTQYSITQFLYIMMNIVELLYFLLYFSGRNGKIIVYRPMIIWLVFQGYLFLSMLINNNFGGVLQWGYLTLMVVNLLFLCEYALVHDFMDLLKAIAIYGSLLLLINYITLLAFEDGVIPPEVYYMQDNATYFLGIKTAFTTMMFPTIAASGAVFLMEKNKKNVLMLIIAIVVSILNMAYKMISTAIVGCILIIAIVIICKITRRRLSNYVLFTSAILAQIAIVFFGVQEVFSVFFQLYFHKDASLSARTYIWKSAKKMIESSNIFHILFGNGIADQQAFVPYSGGLWQPHNQLLVWIYTGGIIGIIILLFYIFGLSKWRSKKNKVYYYLSIVCFAVIFLSVTEVYFDTAVCYVPFLILYFSGKYYEKKV